MFTVGFWLGILRFLYSRVFTCMADAKLGLSVF